MKNLVPIPARIGRLADLADNLWWSWHVPARSLFKAVSYPLWKATRHNPVRMLQTVDPARLQRLAEDPHFLSLYDGIVEHFEADLSNGHLWFPQLKPNLTRPVAYFSAEFGLHGSLPIYSGGLGVLSGDHCKEASDLGLPLVGVGFIYPQGYFRQEIPPDGWQEAYYDTLNFDHVPIHPVHDAHGNRLVVGITLRGVELFVQVWQVRAGRVHLYLMDSNVDRNSPWDRDLSARLYGGDQETRIRQEMVLGIGGVRVLRALGINPSAWHLNEGHSAFLILERLREQVHTGKSFEEAAAAVHSSTVFTTHTPVPAGHDAFPYHLMDEYFGRFWQDMGVSREHFMSLGEYHGRFNMTVLALRLSGWQNGVSQLHGEVSRRMWQPVWPDRPAEQVPIKAITNGVHVPSWLSTPLKGLFEQYVGEEWETYHDDLGLWDRLTDIPDEVLWEVHHQLKGKLLNFVDQRIRSEWRRGGIQPSQVLATGALLDPEALTLGFARRFATYKRATLIFRDTERLKQILHAEGRPVQIVFAGKAHPADAGGKEFIQQVYQYAQDPEFGGRVAFIEDYDIHVARFLTQGVDVWLNNPRRPNEASGTSGMKAAMNGVPNLSALDGWWPEAYHPPVDGRPRNGWAFGEVQYDDWGAQDEIDSQALYHLLEDEIVPLYYDRDADGVPRRWVHVMKEAMRTSLAAFSMRRMVKEYVHEMYLPAWQK
ncbi:MAG TPA: alpha-glucan family phosphorylase [Anaerolineae bacterium]|nr:alpha-glucan family phosphorylase [Anaerolineae bacterium]